MIDWAHTHVQASMERLLTAAAISTVAEGMAMVGVIEGGLGKVKPAAGSTTEGPLLGVAMSPRRTFGVNNGIQTITPVTAARTIVLNALAVGTVGAFRVDTGAQITVSGSSASSSNILAATDSTTGFTSLTFDSSFDSVPFTIVYAYAMSTLQDVGLFGQGTIGTDASAVTGSCGIITKGIVFTNRYVAAANWYAQTTSGVKVLAGGLFAESANAGTGFVPTNATVFQLPSASNPYLGLMLN